MMMIKKISDEEAEKTFEEKYEKKNKKRARSINIPERLFKDYHKFCIDKNESMSKRIRIFMVKDMLESKNSN